MSASFDDNLLSWEAYQDLLVYSSTEEAQMRLRNVVREAQLIIMKHKEMLTDWLRILIEGALRNRSSLWWKAGKCWHMI